MTVRASDTRRGASWVLVTLLFALLLAVGCGDDDSDPTYPPEPEPPVGTWFLGVWGTGPDDVYVVGQPGLIYHWNGTAWNKQDSGVDVALTDVWGPGDGTVYATGHDGVILRKSGGGGWSSMDSGTEEPLFGVGQYDGQIMAAGREGTLRRLDGSTWRNAPEEIYQRDAEQAVIDTLIRSEEIESLTNVTRYGVTGSDGIILMDDPDTDWQLRRVTGGEDWITCATSSDMVTGNFIATDGGRLFQLRETEGGRLAWSERYSPALDAIVYGIHAGVADTVWAVTNDGRINRVDPDNSFQPVYEDGLVLFDIWGTSGTNLYAVGIDGRVLHFHEINPGEYGWELEELPDLPADKAHAEGVFDKFGRPVR